MITRTHDVDASPEQVWSVLADGWLYPVWVVGAARIRAVDETWPAPGSRIHHSAGVWPLMLDDDSEVVERDEPRRLVLRARGWPAGEAQIVIEVEARGPRTRVRLSEDAVRGPGALVPRPVRAVGIGLRNRETLRRLAMLVEGRT